MDIEGDGQGNRKHGGTGDTERVRAALFQSRSAAMCPGFERPARGVTGAEEGCSEEPGGYWFRRGGTGRKKQGLRTSRTGPPAVFWATRGVRVAVAGHQGPDPAGVDPVVAVDHDRVVASGVPIAVVRRQHHLRVRTRICDLTRKCKGVILSRS